MWLRGKGFKYSILLIVCIYVLVITVFFFIELWVNDSCDRVREVLIGRWSGLLLKEGDIAFINGGI